MELVTGGNSEELGLCPYDFQNIGLSYCAHAHPVRQVVARLKAVRAVQGHRAHGFQSGSYRQYSTAQLRVQYI